MKIKKDPAYDFLRVMCADMLLKKIYKHKIYESDFPIIKIIIKDYINMKGDLYEH